MDNKITISKRTLLKRLTHKLKVEKNMMIKKCCLDNNLYSDLGDYFIVNSKSYSIERMNVDLNELAVELNVLRPNEQFITD